MICRTQKFNQSHFRKTLPTNFGKLNSLKLEQDDSELDFFHNRAREGASGNGTLKDYDV